MRMQVDSLKTGIARHNRLEHPADRIRSNPLVLAGAGTTAKAHKQGVIRVHQLSPVSQVLSQMDLRARRKKCLPLLTPLAVDHTASAPDIEIIQIQSAELRYPHASSNQHLDNGPIPQGVTVTTDDLDLLVGQYRLDFVFGLCLLYTSDAADD